MKKFRKLVLIVFAIVCAFAMSISVNAQTRASIVRQANSSTVFDSSYGFSYRFIPGLTTVQPFGCQNNYAQDDWSTNGSDDFEAEGWHMASVTSNSQKGNIGCWYRNVGNYQGKTVDLKITVTGWDAFRTVNTTIDGKKNYPTVCFDKNSIRLSLTTKCFQNIKIKFEFYEHNTNTLISVKCHENLYDIDNGETAYLSNPNINEVWLYQTTELNTSGSTVQCRTGINSSNSDTKHWATLLISGSSFDLTYNRSQDNINSTSKSRTFYNFGFNSGSVAPFNTPSLTKSVNKSVVSTDEGYSYSFNYTLPDQPSGMRYSYLNINDTLKDGIELADTNFSATNDAGQNVTSQFTMSQSGQKVTFSAGSSFLNSGSSYGKTYQFSFNVKPKANYDFKSFLQNGKVNIENNLSVETNYGTKTSNTVNTEIRFKIDSTVKNGTITPSKTNIVGGTSSTYTFKPNKGYEISSIEVDGQDIELGNKQDGSYTFNSITKNHKIDVVCSIRKDCQLTIIKRITQNEIWMPSGTPTFIYKIEGTDVEGNAHNYFRTAEFTDSYVSSHTVNGMVEYSITLKNLYSGNYTVSELDNIRYNFSNIVNLSNATKNGHTAKYNLFDNTNGSATFVNSRTNYKNFSHSDLKINDLN